MLLAWRRKRSHREVVCRASNTKPVDKLAQVVSRSQSAQLPPGVVGINPVYKANALRCRVNVGVGSPTALTCYHRLLLE
jgi:hypothetical protein